MALEKVSNVLLKVFGSRNERLIKGYSAIPEEAQAFEDAVGQLDDEALKAKTAEFKAALAAGKRPEHILPEAKARHWSRRWRCTSCT
jgi:preprotein translocase subunit SecA